MIKWREKMRPPKKKFEKQIPQADFLLFFSLLFMKTEHLVILGG